VQLRRLRIKLALLALSACLSAVAQAQFTSAMSPAASTQRLLEPTPGVNEGLPYGLYGSVGASIVHESNVQHVSSGGESDTRIEVPASLTYRQNLGRHEAQVRATTVFGRYDKFSTEDFNNYGLDAALRLDLTRRLDANLYASYAQAYEERGAPGTPLFQPGDKNKVEISGYGGNIVFGRREAKMQVSVGADTYEWRYKNNNQQSRDRDYDTIYGRVGYTVGPKTTMFVDFVHSDINYLAAAPNQDSTEDSIWGGIEWRATAATQGVVKIGRLKKDFDDPALEDTDQTVYAGTVNWRPKSYTGFSFYATRTTEESSALGASQFISELLGVRWDYNTKNDWGLFAYFNHTTDDFNNGREDTYKDYGFGVTKALRSWLSLQLQYSRIERDSNVPFSDYETNIISLGLNANFTLLEGGRRSQ